MPNARNHFIFAEDFLAVFQGEVDPTALFLGAQGPDPFYFFGRLGRLSGPGRASPENRKTTHGFAEYLHASQPQDVFFPLLRGLSTVSDRVNRSFLMGFLLHYVMDRKLHPYVYYRSGFSGTGTLDDEKAKDHTRFESFMGVALFAQVRGNGKGPSPKELSGSHSSKDVKNTLRALDAFVHTVFPEHIFSGAYAASWTDMIRVLRVLHDPWGVKALCLGSLGQSSHGRALMEPTQRELDSRCPWADILNSAKVPWRHPDTGKTSTESVLDLYQKALDDAQRAAALLAASVSEAGMAEQGWLEFFDTLDHEGRHAGLELRYQGMGKSLSEGIE